MAWTEQAEDLASDAAELGTEIAAGHSAAWRARVDPDVTAGLAAAAVALWVPPAALLGPGKPTPSDRVLIGDVEERQIEAGELLAAATRLQPAVSNALAAAGAGLASALAAARAAATDEDRASAEAAAAACRAAIADCEVALEILAGTAGRLSYAIGALERVPGDLADTYEAAYRLLGRRGRLPKDGDFLTGTFHALAG